MPILIPPAGADVLPATDDAFQAFATQFGAAWQPATFNVVVPTAATIIASAAAFATALTAASDPSTRTSVNIATKDGTRAATAVLLRAAIRAAQIAYLAGTASEAQLNNIGVRANTLTRATIGTPMFSPLLSVDGNTSGTTRLRITQVDPVTGLAVTARAYAYGLTGVELQRKVGTGEWLARQTSRRVNLNELTGDLSIGTVVLYRARYITARGKVSPWSATVTAVAS